jgi:threonine/homoserine/homoserine lactone efflux protein
MLSLNTIVSFFGIALLMAAAPGPEIIFILAQSLAYGRKVGLIVALGNISALVVPTAATALGLGSLIVASPTAFNALKYIGALYLAYLGTKAFLTATDHEPAELPDAEAPTGSLALRGAILGLTNPQTMTFFLAFLPQFVDVNAGDIALQIASLGVLNMVASYVVFATVALTSGFVRHQIARSPSTLRFIDRTAAVVLVGLALRLVIS